MSRKRVLWRRKLWQLTQEKCEGGAGCRHSTHQKRYAHRFHRIPDSEVTSQALASVLPNNIGNRKKKLLLRQFAGGK